MATSSPSKSTAITRGLRGRCPHCGGRRILASLDELQARCPTCGFSFVREEGYWVGAMIVIFGVVLVIFALWFVGGMVVTWPDVPWTVLLIGGLILNGLVPFVLYGWSKAVWVGVDLAFNPARAEELQDG